MSARTISELANWDGRRTQRSSKSHFSSSNLRVDPYSPVLHPHLNNDPFTDALANTRLSTRVDTPATHSEDVHRQHPVAHAPIITAPELSPLSTLSRLSPLSTPSSAHPSRVRATQPSSKREPGVSLAPSSLSGQEIIDLTAEDTADELSVSDMLVPRNVNIGEQYSDPGPSRHRSPSPSSSPLPEDRSLFTPPPRSRKRARMLIDYVAVPSLPKGLTKSDYQPMSEPSTISRDKTPITPAAVFTPASTDESFTQRHPSPIISSSSVKGKGKAREQDVASSLDMDIKRCSPTASIEGIEMPESVFLDAFYPCTTIPLQDADTYPPLTPKDLVLNTRFQFAHAWRRHMSSLQQAEFEWMAKFKVLGIACMDAGLGRSSPPRIPGTTGWVTSEELRDWQLIPLESSPKKIKKKRIPKKAVTKNATEPSPVIDIDVKHAPPAPQPDAASLAANPASHSEPPGWNVPLGDPAMDIHMENDMDQYFNGLGDSPNKHSEPPRQEPYPTHAFRPHFFQFAGQVQMNSTGSEFAHLDPQLIEKADNEPFLGMPPSPPPDDAESPLAPGSVPDSPFKSVGYFQSQPSDDFGQAANMDGWRFRDEGSSFRQGSPSPANQGPPIALGTIDPSLLGGEQPPPSPPRSKVAATPKAQSKLPEPIIYIRRPMDSSSLPLVSGKRPVQIKFRNQETSHPEDDKRDEDEAIPSGSKSASSSVARNRAGRSASLVHDGSPLSKRRMVPSLKRREDYLGFESDTQSYTSRASEATSDFMPESSKPKPKLKLKLKRRRSSGKGREATTESRSLELEALPERSFCHQCRNTTLRPKMQCSNDVGGRVCTRRFCNRCILRRYPEITFDRFSASFLCPVCTNTCNCSVCSRNRGEEFISMRERNFAESRVQARVTLIRDAGEAIPHTTSPVPLRKAQSKDAEGSASARTTPTPEPGSLPTQPMFWAHVYGMEGERMGSAFISHEHIGRMQNQALSPPSPPPKALTQKKKTQKRDKTREKARGPHVFIGRPLKSWRIRAVRDLEPSVDPKSIFGTGNGNGKGKGKASQLRVYVGNPAALHEPYERMPRMAGWTPASSRCSSPMLDSDGSLTPLSELEAEVDYWPQPDVGECCSWAPPPPPGTVAIDGISMSSALSTLTGGFESGVSGSGSPGAVDVGLGSDMSVGVNVDGGLGLGVGIGLSMEVDANPMVDVGADGDKCTRPTLSEADIARAITAALSALNDQSS